MARDLGARGVAVSRLLAVDGDSFAHRAYHALPKSIRAQRRRRLHEHAHAALAGGAAATPCSSRWDTLTVPTYRHEAFEPYQSGRVFEESIARAARDPARGRRASSASSSRRRPATRRTTSSPPPRASGPGDGARRHLGPRRVPARERARDDPPADAGRERDRADRAGRGARALRRRARAGARPDRAARRPVRQAARRARHRPEEGGGDPRRSTARSRTCSPAGRFAAEAEDLRLFRRIATMDASAPLPPLEGTTPTWAEASSFLERLGLGGPSPSASERYRRPDASRARAPAPDRRPPGAAGAARASCSSTGTSGARDARRRRRSCCSATRAEHVERVRAVEDAGVARRRHDLHGDDVRGGGARGGDGDRGGARAAASRSSARPGHHALAGRAMGFCIFNNVAVAARAAQRGSGSSASRSSTSTSTTATAPRRSSATTTASSSSRSTSGRSIRAAAGRTTRRETTLNVPLPAGSGDEEYLRGVRRASSSRRSRASSRELVLVSAGFDAHDDDPLAGDARHRGRLPRARRAAARRSATASPPCSRAATSSRRCRGLVDAALDGFVSELSRRRPDSGAGLRDAIPSSWK